ncbi:hypothetical protein D1872_322110 [compost metagenome]
MVHGQCCAQHAKHHGQIFAAHKARSADKIVLCGRICQLGEEDVLRSLHLGSVNHHGAAKRCLPEWEVKNVVKPQGAEQLDNKAEQK